MAAHAETPDPVLPPARAIALATRPGLPGACWTGDGSGAIVHSEPDGVTLVR